jgi:hypothetical protein
MSEFIGTRMWPGAAVERSIFGTDDPEEIWREVREICPHAVDCFAFEVSVGARLGLRLADGTRVAVKVSRQSHEYLTAVQQVQEHLWRHGFPVPRPLGVRGRGAIEEWRDEGDYLDGHDPAVRAVIASYLAELFRVTEGLEPPAGLAPYFAPPDAPLWPRPHNVLFDFEATAGGAEWIDEIARSAKPLRRVPAGRLVIGHGDWTVKHFRFEGFRPTVIYDWDSLNTDYETVFVGGSAASFTYTEELPVDVWPTEVEAVAFIDDYERARETPFTPEERRAVRAAAVYSRAYSARCTHAVAKDATRMRLGEFAATFLDR